MNPAHEELVNRLRAHAQIESDAHAADLHQAADIIGKLVIFVEDVRDHGLRCDLNPSIIFTDSQSVYSRMCNYLRAADTEMRSRAKRAIGD